MQVDRVGCVQTAACADNAPHRTGIFTNRRMIMAAMLLGARETTISATRNNFEVNVLFCFSASTGGTIGTLAVAIAVLVTTDTVVSGSCIHCGERVV